VLSAILYLGNVVYEQKDVGECLKVGPDHVLSAVSDLLKVPLTTLMFNVNSLHRRLKCCPSYWLLQ